MPSKAEEDTTATPSEIRYAMLSVVDSVSPFTIPMFAQRPAIVRRCMSGVTPSPVEVSGAMPSPVVFSAMFLSFLSLFSKYSKGKRFELRRQPCLSRCLQART